MTAWEALRLRMSDGYTCFARLWRPASPRGAVLYLHGIQSHGGWFEASARRLAEAGLVVLMPDRRGSGRNEVQRGHAASARRLLRDVSEALDALQRQSGHERASIVGVSWGGKLALAYAVRHARRCARLALVAPGLFPVVDLPWRTKLRIAIAAIARRRVMFDIPLNDPALFTSDEGRRRFLRDDRLALHQATAQFLIASRRLDQIARSAARCDVGCPLRVFLAGQERIIDNERTRAFVRSLPWLRREIITYPDAHHVLEFEADSEGYFRDLVEWIGGTRENIESRIEN